MKMILFDELKDSTKNDLFNVVASSGDHNTRIVTKEQINLAIIETRKILQRLKKEGRRI